MAPHASDRFRRSGTARNRHLQGSHGSHGSHCPESGVRSNAEDDSAHYLRRRYGSSSCAVGGQQEAEMLQVPQYRHVKAKCALSKVVCSKCGQEGHGAEKCVSSKTPCPACQGPSSRLTSVELLTRRFVHSTTRGEGWMKTHHMWRT